MPPRQELTGATRRSGYDRRSKTFVQASPSTLRLSLSEYTGRLPGCSGQERFWVNVGQAPRLKSPYLPAGAGAAGAAAEAAETLAASTHDFLSASHPFPARPKFRSNNITFQISSSDSLLFHAFIFVLGTPSEIRQIHTESE